jgi:alkylation response protein AidB-like acyl-CoA dehydrogenase
MPRQIASSESGIRGARELLRPEGDAENFTFRGVKQFASGAAFVQCPIVTAERHGGGWQMTLLRMESTEVTSSVNHDSSFWHPLGMEASESYSIDFTGASISARDLIGAPGDFYRDPFFQGGAIRFAALQAGAILRLHHLFANWLEQTGRGGDPIKSRDWAKSRLVRRRLFCGSKGPQPPPRNIFEAMPISLPLRA